MHIFEVNKQENNHITHTHVTNEHITNNLYQDTVTITLERYEELKKSKEEFQAEHTRLIRLLSMGLKRHVRKEVDVSNQLEAERIEYTVDKITIKRLISEMMGIPMIGIRFE